MKRTRVEEWLCQQVVVPVRAHIEHIQDEDDDSTATGSIAARSDFSKNEVETVATGSEDSSIVMASVDVPLEATATPTRGKRGRKAPSEVGVEKLAMVRELIGENSGLDEERLLLDCEGQVERVAALVFGNPTYVNKNYKTSNVGDAADD
jgi:hypothetical protein